MSGQGEILLPSKWGIRLQCRAEASALELQDEAESTRRPTASRCSYRVRLMEIFNRLRGQCWRENDVREPIRLGLVGGGAEVKSRSTT